MIHTKDHKTLHIFGPFPFLGPKRRQLIERSWAKLFREHILLELPVGKIFNNYKWLNGRPSKELYAMLGLMILQQMHDLTDVEAIHQFAFNLEWHYALDITNESDAESYLCPKTLWMMRYVLTEQNLYGVLFEGVKKWGLRGCDSVARSLSPTNTRYKPFIFWNEDLPIKIGG